MDSILGDLGFADITPPSTTQQLLSEHSAIAASVNRGEISREEALERYKALKERAVAQ